MKTTNLLFTALMAVSLTFSTIACGSSQNEKANAASDIGKEKAQKVLNAYLDIKDALVATNENKAGQAAGKIVNLLKGSDNEMSKNIQSEAKKVAESDDVKAQRAAFSALSGQVYQAVKSTGIPSGSLYKKHCPMALDNEGAFWLSSKEAIRNPYFGDKMLKCGSVKETL